MSLTRVRWEGMKICVIAPGFNRHGGVPYVARNIVDQLTHRGAECWVVTDGEASDDVRLDLSSEVPIYTRKRGQRAFPLNIVRFARRVGPLLKKLESSHGLDLIHTHGNYVLAPLITRYLSGLDTPVVTTLHDTHLPEIRSFRDYPPFKRKWRYCTGIYLDYRIQRFAAPRVDRIHTVGSRVKSELTELGIDPATVGLVHNGVDPSEFESVEPKPDVRDLYDLQGSDLVISVGSLRPRKGIHTLVEAADIIRGESTDVHVAHIGGHGRTGYVEYLESRIEELGLGDTVSFIGPVPRSELLGWYAAADALVSASYSEGNPINVLEAGISECAIVTTEVWDAREILGKAGTYVTVGSPESVASGIMQGLDRGNGSAIKDRITANYTWDVVGDEYFSLFNRWANELSHSQNIK